MNDIYFRASIDTIKNKYYWKRNSEWFKVPKFLGISDFNPYKFYIKIPVTDHNHHHI